VALSMAALALAIAAGCAGAARRARTPRRGRAWLLASGTSGAATIYLLVAAAVLEPSVTARFHPLDGAAAGPLHQPDADLGFAHRPGARVRAVREVEGRVTYDVVYTIGADGLRVTPPARGAKPVVFFGCSYTFGDGVDDDETLPAQLVAALGGQADVVNRAVGGYGSHQMLRALETGRAPIPPGAHVFYQGLGDHVRRVAGKAPWDDAGPRYELDGDGVRWTGPLHAPLVRPLRGIARVLARNGILPRRVFGYAVSDDERELFVRVVVRAAERVHAAGGRFTVIFWDDTPDASTVADLLAARGLEVWRMTALLPGVDRAPLFLPHDTHPGAEIHRLLAAAVAQRMQRGSPS